MNALALIATLLAASPDCHRCENEGAIAEEHWARTYKGTHTELSFGYLGQWSDETNRGLELKPAATDPAIAGAVVDPFLGAPFSGSIQPGATLESRVIYRGLRTTVGVRFPFLNFRPSATAQTVNIGGAPHEVVVRSVSLWDFRTGIGYELPFTYVTPFVDVLGDVQTMTTQVVIDGAPAKYAGSAFSLGGRVGLRCQFKHAFLALSAEAMTLGATRFGGSAQLGVAF